MASVMSDTVKQLFNLIWFCKKVAIPFEVYAFTHDYPLISYDAEGKSNIRQLSYQKNTDQGRGASSKLLLNKEASCNTSAIFSIGLCITLTGL